MKKMEVPAPLALPEELEFTEMEMSDEVFIITAHCTQEHPCCPHGHSSQASSLFSRVGAASVRKQEQ